MDVQIVRTSDPEIGPGRRPRPADFRLARQAQSAVFAALLGLSSFAALTYLVAQYDAVLVLPLLLVLGLSGLALTLLLRWPDAATLVVVFLIYLNIPAIAHQTYGVPKVAAGAFTLLLGVPLIHSAIVRRQPLKIDGFFVLMLCFLGVLLLSSLIAKDKSIALGRVQAFVVEGLLLYWLILNVAHRLPDLRRVIGAALAAASLLGCLSLYQTVTGNIDQQFGGLAERQLKYEFKRDRNAAPAEAPRMYQSDRADGPLLGNNRYGQVMMVLLPLAVFTSRRGQTGRVRVVAAAAGVLILSGMVLTYSRGTLLIFVILIAIAALLKWLRPAHVLAGALCAVLALPLVAPGLLNRVATIGTAAALVNEDSSEDPDGAIRGRATAMMAAFHVFLDHPVLGVGPGNYVPLYSVEYFQNPEIKFREIRGQRRAHSLYLEMAADTGLIGLISFLAIPFSLLAALWRLRRQNAVRNPFLADLATAFFLSILAYLGTAIFLHLAFQRYYWLLIAMGGAAVHVIHAEGANATIGAVDSTAQEAADERRRAQPIPQTT
jgi:putative inorganic carbon (hco3(-)) transporter